MMAPVLTIIACCRTMVKEQLESGRKNSPTAIWWATSKEDGL